MSKENVRPRKLDSFLRPLNMRFAVEPIRVGSFPIWKTENIRFLKFVHFDANWLIIHLHLVQVIIYQSLKGFCHVTKKKLNKN
jgi:5-methylcytosine-specific restriction endonuclease McrBC regulatory subunit McrC